MTSPLLLLLFLMLLVQVSRSKAEPCHKKNYPTKLDRVWELLCPRENRKAAEIQSKAAPPVNRIVKIQEDRQTDLGNEIPSHVVKMGHDRDNEEKLSTGNVKTLKKDVNTKDEETRTASRQHKAYFANYPVPQRIYQNKGAKPTTIPPPTKKQRRRKPSKHRKQPESAVYVVRLPPVPYSYVPGLGYVSRPPVFATSKLGGARPFLDLPIEFVSNGKPIGVYRWSPQTDRRPSPQQRPFGDSPLIRLNRGPYVFDGRPTSVVRATRRDPRLPIPDYRGQ